MRPRSRARRLGPLHRVGPLVLLALAAPFARPATAQVPEDTVPPAEVPADTVPEPALPDTLEQDTAVVPIPPTEVEADTLPADSLMAEADSLVVVPPFPRYEQPLPTGWAFGRWEFEREQLLVHNGLSILEFLARVPGLAMFRSGDRGFPLGITALGLGGGRLRVFLDGFELDPLGFGAPDLQAIGILDLESVTVERDLGGVRLDLVTIRTPGPRPLSGVEVGAGTYDLKFLRGLFIRGFGSKSILSASYDVLSTQGFAYAAPYSTGSGRASWSYAVSEETGLKLEFRTGRVERPAEPFREDATYGMLLARARSELRPGLIVDGAVGRRWRNPGEDDSLTADLSGIQAMLRAQGTFRGAWVEAGARARGQDLAVTAAPSVELFSRAALRPSPWLQLSGEARSAGAGGVTGLEWRGTGRLGGDTGPYVFGTLGAGARALGLVRDTVWEVEAEPGEEVEPGTMVQVVEPRFDVVSSGAGGLRVGGGWRAPGIQAGVAAVSLAASTLVPFGVGFDRGLPAVEANAALGIEGTFTMQLPGSRGGAWLEASYSRFPETGGRPYLPEELGYAAISYSETFYDNQLEPTARVSLTRRGAALVANPESAGFDFVTQAYTTLDLFLQIRILAVQAFGLWENFLDQRGQQDVAGRPLPGQRLLYGIRWYFLD